MQKRRIKGRGCVFIVRLITEWEHLQTACRPPLKKTTSKRRKEGQLTFSTGLIMSNRAVLGGGAYLTLRLTMQKRLVGFILLLGSFSLNRAGGPPAHRQRRCPSLGIKLVDGAQAGGEEGGVVWLLHLQRLAGAASLIQHQAAGSGREETGRRKVSTLPKREAERAPSAEETGRQDMPAGLGQAKGWAAGRLTHLFLSACASSTSCTASRSSGECCAARSAQPRLAWVACSKLRWRTRRTSEAYLRSR